MRQAWPHAQLTKRGEYRLAAIRRDAWTKLAADLRLDAEALRTRVAAMCAALPDHASSIARRIRADGHRHPILKRLIDALARHTKSCSARM